VLHLRARFPVPSRRPFSSHRVGLRPLACPSVRPIDQSLVGGGGGSLAGWLVSWLASAVSRCPSPNWPPRLTDPCRLATRRPPRAAAWHHATTRSTANIHNRALQLAVSSRNKAARLRDNDTIRSAEKLAAQSTTRGTARKKITKKNEKEKRTNTDYPARAVLVDVETSSLTSLVRHTFSPARRHTSVCLIPELQQFMHRL